MIADRLSRSVVALALCGAATAATATAVGWRNDGSGCWPDADPPVAWSDGTVGRLVEEPDPKKEGGTRRVLRFFREGAAANIRWRTLLPNWSNASPVVVGDRVFVTADPLDIAPLLVCVDADSGGILWQRELDHLACIPEGDRTEVRERWSRERQLARQGARLFAEMRAAQRALKAAPDDADARAAWAGWEQRAAGAHFAIDPKGKNVGKWGGVPLAPGYLPDDLVAAERTLAKYNCRPLTWEVGLHKGGRRLQVGAYTGWSHPTPASDGERVYVFTGYNHVSAWSLDGHLAWQRWLGATPAGKGGGWVDYTQSPVLVDGRLLVASKASLTALDPATGEVAWQAAVDPAHRALATGYQCLLMTGVVLEVGGEACFFWYDGRVYRVRDGRPLTERLMGGDPLLVSACPLAAGDVLVSCTLKPSEKNRKGEPTATAVRLSAGDGDSLTADELWSMSLPAGPHTGLIADGRLYLPLAGARPTPGKLNPGKRGEQDFILELATGKVLGRALFGTDHHSGILRAGDRLYVPASLRSGEGLCRVFDLEGQPLGENLLSSAERTPERLRLIREHRGADAWNDGYYHGSFHALPCFAGKRIYFRSRDELICVGEE